MGDRKKKNLFLLPTVLKRKKKAPVTRDILEEKRMLLNDIESLIGDYRFKRDTLIFIVNHYLEQFYDTLMYEKTKGSQRVRHNLTTKEQQT